MTADQRDDPEDVLAKLSRKFAADLPARVMEVRDLWAKARAADPVNPENAELWTLLMSRFHYLSGTGGTFGMPEVSRHAGEAETIIIALLEEPRAPTAEEMESLNAAIEALSDLAAEI